MHGSPTDDASGRRWRGLVLAGIVLVIGVPLVLFAWLSDRNADREAASLAQDLRVAARLVNDVPDLFARESMHADDDAGDRPGPLADALGNEDRFVGALFGNDALSAAYEVRWGLAARCVHLLVRDDEVRTDVVDSASCGPRTP